LRLVTSSCSTPRSEPATSRRWWSSSPTTHRSNSSACPPARSKDALRSPPRTAPNRRRTLTVLSVRVEEDGTVVEPFSWSADAGARSGEMRLVVAGDRIRRLVIRF